MEHNRMKGLQKTKKANRSKIKRRHKSVQKIKNEILRGKEIIILG